jgi:ankyrin repeat protein
VVKLLLGSGKANPDFTDKDGRTPLSWAARVGHEVVVKLLLETGKVDVDLIDKELPNAIIMGSKRPPTCCHRTTT